MSDAPHSHCPWVTAGTEPPPPRAWERMAGPTLPWLRGWGPPPNRPGSDAPTIQRTETQG